MAKKKKILLIAGVVCLVICLAIVLILVGRSAGNKNPEATVGGDMTYTVQVMTKSGSAIVDLGVYIYEDETLSELVWFDKTDAEGKITFTDKASDRFVAVLDDVPVGFVAKDYYPLTGEFTQIVLTSGAMEEVDPDELRYELGDQMLDFTIASVDGTKYNLAELLKTKKAVILNFWYVECDPCKMEFPFLEEAYALYHNEVEILAMNPVNNDDAAIAAFQKELGLSFPMAMVDPIWAEIMQITAYPTTVVIDRYGTISLIHKGSIDNATTFKQMFEYFTSEDYVQKPIESIDEILEQMQEGTEDNPFELAGVTSFEVTVQPGQTFHINFYKIVGNKYLTISGEEFYVTYKDKKYEPSRGKVGISMASEGPSVAVPLTITNTSKEEQTYKGTLGDPKGSYGNPYTLELGEFTVEVPAGNEQGIYYVYTATEDGKLTVQCLESTRGVEYGYTLYNLNSYAYRTLESDGEEDEEGIPTLSVNVKKGQRVQLIVSTLPDDTNSYPAGTFKMLATMGEGDEEDEKIDPIKETYTLTVKDQDGTPVKDVSINFKGEFTYVHPEEEDSEDGTGDTSDEETGEKPDETTEEPPVTDEDPTDEPEDPNAGTEGGDGENEEGSEEGDGEEGEEEEDPRIIEVKVDLNLTTDEKGVASTEQIIGPYTATVRIPTGYALEQTQYELTQENPSAQITLRKILSHDYTVTILDPAGNPVPNVSVMIGTNFGLTNTKGVYSMHLEEGVYTVFIIGGIPEEYSLPMDSFTFEEGTTQLEIQLLDQPGTEGNPITVHGEFPIKTNAIAPGAELYYNVFGAAGAKMVIEDPTAYVTMDGMFYPAEGGKVTVFLPENTGPRQPISFAVGNFGTTERSYTINFEFPLGTSQNPEVIGSVPGEMMVHLEKGNEIGYYLTWKAENSGKLTIELGEGSTGAAGEDFDVMLSSPNDESSPLLSESEDGTISVNVNAGAAVSVLVSAMPGEDWSYPAQSVALKISFTDGEGGDAPGGEEEDKTERVYTVRIVDEAGKPMAGVAVQILQDGVSQAAGMTGENGTFQATLAGGTYQVRLAFTETGLYYEEVTAVMTAKKPDVTITVTKTVPGEGVVDHWMLGNAGSVDVGSTYVTMQSDVVNYFLFAPEQSGTYQFTTSDPAAIISYWGTESWPSDLTETTDYADNKFTLSINESRLGQSYVLGVSGAEDCILIITRLGEAAFDPTELPYTDYEAKTPPTAFTLKEDGSKLNYVNLAATTASYSLVKGSDGYYHIGTADGPVMYMNLGANAPYLSVYMMCGGNGQTGTALRYNDYTDPLNIIKEDYTECILEYGACIDPTYGVYPLTDDLMYMLKMGGTHLGWWDSENANYLFADVENLNTEIAWMFACCYVGDVDIEIGGGEEEGPKEYVVTVVDYLDAPQAGVAVQILKDGVPVKAGVTDAAGQFKTELDAANYQVKLAFAGTGSYYEEKLTVLTPELAELTIRVTSTVPGPGVTDHWVLGNAGSVGLGGTYVTLQADIVNYFVFTPEEEGTYRFTTSDPEAVISYWGGTSWPTDQTANTDYKDNVFNLSINASYIGQGYAIGVTGAADCIIEITRTGAAAFNPDEIPYVSYEAKTPPKKFTLKMSAGQELKYVDLRKTAADYPLVLGSDGYYHIGSADGPLMYVNLGSSAPYLSLYYMCGGSGGNTGTALRYRDYSDLNNIVKEDYTNCILEYGACMDSTYGVYPLTEDLKYMIQMGGGYMRWWDSTSPNYLFADITNMNPDIGWMFLCCYVE